VGKYHDENFLEFSGGKDLCLRALEPGSSSVFGVVLTHPYVGINSDLLYGILSDKSGFYTTDGRRS